MKNCFLIALVTALCLAIPVEGETAKAAACDSKASGEITISHQIPCDITQPKAKKGKPGVKPKPPTLTGDDYAAFAWNTFIAMSWPTTDPATDAANRGVPDTSKNFGDTSPLVVWDSWRGKRELYRVVEKGAKYSYGVPPAWDAKSTRPNSKIPMCPGVKGSHAKSMAVMEADKVSNFVDETDEIGLALLWKAGAALPTEDGILRYQVKYNYDHYDHIRSNKLYDSATLRKAISSSPNKFSIVLPSGVNGATAADGDMGSILVKTAWMQVDAAEAPDYYTKKALSYRQHQGEPCYEVGTYGLIAIHIIRKTAHFPYFFFSTFESVKNSSTKFDYANTNVAGAGKTFASTLSNSFGQTYSHPANPLPNSTSSEFHSYLSDRLIPATNAVDRANKTARHLIETTNASAVWSNYQLVGVQVRPVNGKSGVYDSSKDDQEYYLANPVVETNQRFQFFEGTFGKSGVPNVILYENDDPSKPAKKNAAGKTMSVNMGGCMGCHGVAQMKGSDFSFTAKDPLAALTGFTAETLTEKCPELGLFYSPVSRGCVGLLAVGVDGALYTSGAAGEAPSKSTGPAPAKKVVAATIARKAVTGTVRGTTRTLLAQGAILSVDSAGNILLQGDLTSPATMFAKANAATVKKYGKITSIALDGSGKIYTFRANSSNLFQTDPAKPSSPKMLSASLTKGARLATQKDGTIVAYSGGNFYSFDSTKGSFGSAIAAGLDIDSFALTRGGRVVAVKAGTKKQLYSGQKLGGHLTLVATESVALAGLALP